MRNTYIILVGKHPLGIQEGSRITTVKWVLKQRFLNIGGEWHWLRIVSSGMLLY